MCCKLRVGATASRTVSQNTRRDGAMLKSFALCAKGRGYFYMLTASHFGTQPPSAGTQAPPDFRSLRPKRKRKRAARHSRFFSATCLTYRIFLPISPPCLPFCSVLRPVPQSIMPFVLSFIALCPSFAQCIALSIVPHFLALPCTALPHAIPCRAPAPDPATGGSRGAFRAMPPLKL